MAVAGVRWHTGSQTKTGGYDIPFTLTASVPAGNLLVVWVGFDNRDITTPVIGSITRQAGETANWARIAFHNASTASSAVSCRSEMWAILTTVPWAAGTYTASLLTYSVLAKCGVVGEFSGVTPSLRGTAGSGLQGSGTPTATTGGTAPAAGDLVLGGATFASPVLAAADADTLNGAWSAGTSIATSGGAGTDNISVTMQYKIVTAAGHQTYNPTATLNSGACVVALVPAAAANDLWVWDGATEKPADVTVWNGATELAAGVSIT